MISVKLWIMSNQVKQRLDAVFAGAPDGGHAAAAALAGGAVLALLGWILKAMLHVHW
jgi:hypothetical protein